MRTDEELIAMRDRALNIDDIPWRPYHPYWVRLKGSEEWMIRSGDYHCGPIEDVLIVTGINEKTRDVFAPVKTEE